MYTIELPTPYDYFFKEVIESSDKFIKFSHNKSKQYVLSYNVTETWNIQ